MATSRRASDQTWGLSMAVRQMLSFLEQVCSSLPLVCPTTLSLEGYKNNSHTFSSPSVLKWAGAGNSLTLASHLGGCSMMAAGESHLEASSSINCLVTACLRYKARNHGDSPETGKGAPGVHVWTPSQLVTLFRKIFELLGFRA